MEQPRKHFKKRDAILSCLRSTDVHPSAEWVYAQLKPQIPDISLATVYRNLSLFKQQGLIVSLGTVGGVERFDGITAPHVHFICTGCHSVVDLQEIEIPEALSRSVQNRCGGSVQSCNLSFQGICRECIHKTN